MCRGRDELKPGPVAERKAVLMASRGPIENEFSIITQAVKRVPPKLHDDPSGITRMSAFDPHRAQGTDDAFRRY